MRHVALLICALLLLSHAGHAAETTRTPAASISIIIDDLGNNLRAGRRTIELPGAVGCAVLPHTPYAAQLAREAHARRKEVILHLPMESADGVDLGPGSVHTQMPQLMIAMTLRDGLRAVPHVVGVSSHMGSLFTTRPQPLRWLLQALSEEGNLFFIDSRTTAESVVPEVADELGVPYLVRNVFLDRERNPDAIDAQFKRLIEAAREHGTALAIGHPYAETLTFLEHRLPLLADSDVELVPLSTISALHNEEQPR